MTHLTAALIAVGYLVALGTCAGRRMIRIELLPDRLVQREPAVGTFAQPLGSLSRIPVSVGHLAHNDQACKLAERLRASRATDQAEQLGRGDVCSQPRADRKQYPQHGTAEPHHTASGCRRADTQGNQQEPSVTLVSVLNEVFPQRHGRRFYGQRPARALAWLTRIAALSRSHNAGLDARSWRHPAGFLAFIFIVGVLYSHKTVCMGVPLTAERQAPNDPVHDTTLSFISVPNVSEDVKQTASSNNRAEFSLASERGLLRKFDKLGFRDIQMPSDEIIRRGHFIGRLHRQPRGAGKYYEMRILDYCSHAADILDVATSSHLLYAEGKRRGRCGPLNHDIPYADPGAMIGHKLDAANLFLLLKDVRLSGSEEHLFLRQRDALLHKVSLFLRNPRLSLHQGGLTSVGEPLKDRDGKQCRADDDTEDSPKPRRFFICVAFVLGGFQIDAWGRRNSNRGWLLIGSFAKICGITFFAFGLLLWWLTCFSWSWGWWI
jgi:hypothetical protein